MKKIKVAITGGIGSGKSAALGYFENKNYPVFSCDEIYKSVIQSEEYIEKLSNLFPDVIINGKVDRKKLAQQIFSDDNKKCALEQIAHPMIMKQLFFEMEQCDDRLVFAEVPLLFEGDFQGQFDHVIVILRQMEERIESIQNRDGLSLVEIETRINKQFDYDSSKSRQFLEEIGGYIVYNGTLEDLYKQLGDVLEKIQA